MVGFCQIEMNQRKNHPSNPREVGGYESNIVKPICGVKYAMYAIYTVYAMMSDKYMYNYNTHVR